MLSTYVQGLAVGMSLIIAIGAQNTFVLKQGLKKQFVFLGMFCLCIVGFDSNCLGRFWFFKSASALS